MSYTNDHAVVYTETVVHAPPQQYADVAPYQLAILTFPGGTRRTVRIVAPTADDRVRIGDRVEFVEDIAGIGFYRKAQ